MIKLAIHQQYQRRCESRNDHEVGMLSNRSPERFLPGGIAVGVLLLLIRRLPFSHVNLIMHVQWSEKRVCSEMWQNGVYRIE